MWQREIHWNQAVSSFYLGKIISYLIIKTYKTVGKMIQFLRCIVQFYAVSKKCILGLM